MPIYISVIVYLVIYNASLVDKPKYGYSTTRSCRLSALDMLFDFVYTPHSARAIAEAKKPAPPQGRHATAPGPAPEPAPKAQVAFSQWGLPQAAPPAAVPSRSKASGATPSGPASGTAPAGKKSSGQSGSFPPMPSKAQQQV